MERVALNGRYIDHSSLRIVGLPIFSKLFNTHVQGVNWSSVVTPSMIYGVSGVPIAKTRGKYQAGASIDIIAEAWDQMTQELAAANIDGYSDIDFNLVIQYQSPGRKPFRIDVVGASLGGGSGSSKQGGDGVVINVNLNPLYVLENGVCAYARDLDQVATLAVQQ